MIPHVDYAVCFQVHQQSKRLILRYLRNLLKWRLREYLIWKDVLQCSKSKLDCKNMHFPFYYYLRIKTEWGRTRWRRKKSKRHLAFFVYFWDLFLKTTCLHWRWPSSLHACELPLFLLVITVSNVPQEAPCGVIWFPNHPFMIIASNSSKYYIYMTNLISTMGGSLKESIPRSQVCFSVWETIFS